MTDNIVTIRVIIRIVDVGTKSAFLKFEERRVQLQEVHECPRRRGAHNLVQHARQLRRQQSPCTRREHKRLRQHDSDGEDQMHRDLVCRETGREDGRAGRGALGAVRVQHTSQQMFIRRGQRCEHNVVRLPQPSVAEQQRRVAALRRERDALEDADGHPVVRHEGKEIGAVLARRVHDFEVRCGVPSHEGAGEGVHEVPGGIGLQQQREGVLRDQGSRGLRQRSPQCLHRHPVPAGKTGLDKIQRHAKLLRRDAAFDGRHNTARFLCLYVDVEHHLVVRWHRRAYPRHSGRGDVVPAIRRGHRLPGPLLNVVEEVSVRHGVRHGTEGVDLSQNEHKLVDGEVLDVAGHKKVAAGCCYHNRFFVLLVLPPPPAPELPSLRCRNPRS
eukprot:PhM_4_TR12798/c0_g2_i1/m.48469